MRASCKEHQNNADADAARPCPFYSQGRCLFADSCNFLHEVKIRAAVDPDALTITRNRNGLPTVTIESPMATRSPPRSPRMSSLLSMLEGIIGPDDTYSAEEGALVQKDGQIRLVEAAGGLALSGMNAQSRRVGKLYYSVSLQSITNAVFSQ